MDSQNVLISIGLPTYKCESRIQKVLEALLGQDYHSIELIISDDASPDNGYKIIEETVKKDKRIKFFRQAKNIGYLRNFELVLKEAKGEYFMWAADDDNWEKNFITTLKEILDKNPDYAMAMPSMRQVYNDGQVYKEIIFSGLKNLTKMTHLEVFKTALKKNPPVEFLYYGLWRTKILKNLVFFTKDGNGFYNTIAHDKILIHEAALSYHFYTIPDILWYKTVHREVFFERYSVDSKKMFLDSKGYWKYVFGDLKRLILSPNIPPTRKLILPYFISAILWAEKKDLLHELSPRLFEMLRRLFR